MIRTAKIVHVSESKRKRVESLQVMLLDGTGEMVHVLAAKPNALRYAMPGGYGVVSLVYISRMLQMKLGSALEVALYCMSKCDYGGICMEKNADIAKELGMTKTYVSTLIGKLHHKGVLHRVGPRTVFMNPAFFFRGKPADQHIAIERWSQYRRELMGVVSEEDAA